MTNEVIQSPRARAERCGSWFSKWVYYLTQGGALINFLSLWKGRGVKEPLLPDKQSCDGVRHVSEV